MKDFDSWQRANEEALGNELIRLRARLAGESVGGEARPAEKKRRGKGPTHVPAIDILAKRLELSPFERDVLMLCAAVEFDPSLPRMCAEVQGDSHRPYPTFALAMSLLEAPAWDAMSPQRPLRRLRLIEVNQPTATPLTAAALRADERIVNFIKGLNALDERLELLLDRVLDEGSELADSQRAAAEGVIAELQQERSAGGSTSIVEFVGPDGQCKRAVAAQIAALFGLVVYRLAAELIPADFGELETLLRLWEREQRLLPLSLYIDARELDDAAFSQASSAINRFAARVEGLVFLDVSLQRQIPGRMAIYADVAKPSPVEQRALWAELTDDAEGAAQLSCQFSFNPADIRRLAARSPGDPQKLWADCCRASRPQLDALATRIDAKATWDDLVLPDEQLEQLREITSQVRHRSRVYDDWGFRARANRGLGISALFAGESGTGKTMAAEVIANDLRLDLYRIDLSAVVNKYIGETEKNLRRLFDAADDGGAILLFDEADALFGKRTDVKDSHDRYANLEVNYLLQRMESYRGLAVLATNLKGSLDKAFLRRLRFVVDFPMPDAGQRHSIWQRVLPADVACPDVDLHSLSAATATGANIHSAALRALFHSASESSNLAQRHLVRAVRTEFRQLQKPFNASVAISDCARGIR